MSVRSNIKNNNLHPTLIISDNLQSKFNNNKATPISLIEKNTILKMGLTKVNKEDKIRRVNKSFNG